MVLNPHIKFNIAAIIPNLRRATTGSLVEAVQLLLSTFNNTKNRAACCNTRQAIVQRAGRVAAVGHVHMALSSEFEFDKDDNSHFVADSGSNGYSIQKNKRRIRVRCCRDWAWRHTPFRHAMRELLLCSTRADEGFRSLRLRPQKYDPWSTADMLLT